MSHWHQQMVDGAEFWINCKWLKALREAGQWQLIKCQPEDLETTRLNLDWHEYIALHPIKCTNYSPECQILSHILMWKINFWI